MHAEQLPSSISVPSLVLIAQAVFLLQCRHTSTHVHTQSQMPLITLPTLSATPAWVVGSFGHFVCHKTTSRAVSIVAVWQSLHRCWQRLWHCFIMTLKLILLIVTWTIAGWCWIARYSTVNPVVRFPTAVLLSLTRFALKVFFFVNCHCLCRLVLDIKRRFCKSINNPLNSFLLVLLRRASNMKKTYLATVVSLINFLYLLLVSSFSSQVQN